MLGAYTRWFNSWALLAGWAVGTFAGTAMAHRHETHDDFSPGDRGPHLPGYTAVYTVILNLGGVTVALMPVFNAMGPRGAPVSTKLPLADYHV